MINNEFDSLDAVREKHNNTPKDTESNAMEVLPASNTKSSENKNKQLLPVKPKLPEILKKKIEQNPMPMLTYAPIDSSHYSFTYDFDETVSFRMDEAENTTRVNDFVEAEYSEYVQESDKVYYAIAAASGALTGALSFIKLSEEQLRKIEQFKKTDWQPIVIYVAELAGCKKKDYKSASKYLVDQAVRKIMKDETVKEYLTHLAAHPTMAGLVFSMIVQFSGKQLTISESGEIKASKLPKYYYVGDTNSEKIVSAILYWLFTLAANQAQSKRSIIDNLGLPTELIKKVKAFVNIPFIKNIPNSYEEAEEQFSNWLRNTISGAELVSDEDGEGQQKLILKLMKIVLELGNDAFPVLINECVVRSLYILVRLCDVIKEKNVASFEELRSIPAMLVLPQNNRILSKMCLVASASFVGVNLSIAALKAISTKKAGDRKFLSAFLTEVNIVGIGRLVFACIADSKYWGDDVKPRFQRKPHSHKKEDDSFDWTEGESSFTPLALDAIQARLLYCFENLCVRKDIEKTADTEDSKTKKTWLADWRSCIVSGAGIPAEFQDQYFIEDETLLYDGIYELSKNKENFGWFYLLTQELALFKPYFSLGSEKDAKYKKLKQQYNYVSDQFVRRQTIVSQAEVDAVLSAYKKNQNYISGRTTVLIATAVGGSAVIVITGGLALTFAPGIAAMIAGEAIAGLHGAALTSASLAFVGGGSLAAGGLGMAGGTAIITGGGALIGLASTGGVSAASFMMMATSEYWIRQGAKLLTYCKCILCDTLKDNVSLKRILLQVTKVEKETNEELQALKTEDNELDNDYVKKLKEYHMYLTKVQKELQKYATHNEAEKE